MTQLTKDLEKSLIEKGEKVLLKKSSDTVRPLVYKGSWARDRLSGDGILKLSNGLIILA
jgi:hypothetical protein